MHLSFPSPVLGKALLKGACGATVSRGCSQLTAATSSKGTLCVSGRQPCPVPTRPHPAGTGAAELGAAAQPGARALGHTCPSSPIVSQASSAAPAPPTPSLPPLLPALLLWLDSYCPSVSLPISRCPSRNWMSSEERALQRPGVQGNGNAGEGCSPVKTSKSASPCFQLTPSDC